MHGTNGNLYVGTTSYANYKQNLQWHQSFRAHGKEGSHVYQNGQNFSYQYWCETCDRGFTTERFLENHRLQHQKCKIDGCQFVAHPKIVTQHIKMQHSTGLYKKIAKLNNPENIKKWRDERKKKYPTIDNIKKKEAELKEKISRGEKMGIKHERDKDNNKLDTNTCINNKLEFQNKSYHKVLQTSRGKPGKYNRNIRNNRKREVATDSSKQLQSSKKICKIIPSVVETRQIKPFGGIQTMIMDEDADEDKSEIQSNDPIEDDEDFNIENTIQKGTSPTDPIVCSALTSLICCYGSSDEDDTEMTSNKATMNCFNKSGTNKAQDIKSFNKIENPDNQSIKINEINNLSKKAKKESSQNIMILEDTKDFKCQVDTDNESGPEEVKVIKEQTSSPIDHSKTSSNTRPKKVYEQRNKFANEKYELGKRDKLPSTLLEKLLHREIQHERNVILQCVRYIVKNKYFENN